jgi:hypothetical protein
VSLLAIVAAVGLGACGDGGDDQEPSAEEQQIAKVIEEAAIRADPANCSELQTESFNEQIYLETGEEATEACEEEPEEDQADSVEVSEIEVDGTTATAEAAIGGGDFDGQTLALELVKEDEQWKIDRLADFAELDRDSLNAAFAENVDRDGETPEELRDCVVEEFESFSDHEVEDLYLSGDPQRFLDAFGACFDE